MSQADRAREAEEKLDEAITAIDEYLVAVDKLSKCRFPAEYSDANREINLTRLKVQGAVNRYKLDKEEGLSPETIAGIKRTVGNMNPEERRQFAELARKVEAMPPTT